MINPVSDATQVQNVYQSATTRPSTPAAETQSEPTDTVQLSQAALAQRAVAQEASETPAQTAKEAAHGDIQAKHRLAREQAQKAE